MKRIVLLGWILIFAGAHGTIVRAGSGAPDPSVNASRMLRDAAMMLLKEGNVRYVSGRTQHPNLEAERRSATAAHGQEPFATVLACSDSREPVELVFDRGVGDLFVIRVAGNVAGVSELASVEYGATHLGTPLLIVMGHTRCGAVTATVKGAELHGHLPKIAEKIKPAADKARAEAPNADDVVPAAVKANVWQTVADILLQSSLVRGRVAGGHVQIVGALYDIETGRVNWLGTHPEEESLLAKGLAAEQSPSRPEPPPPEPHAPPAAQDPEAAPAKPAGQTAADPPANPATTNAAHKPKAVKPFLPVDTAVHQGDPARLLQPASKNTRPSGH